MTRSRVLRLAAVGAVVLVLGACAWVLGGNAVAARREREAAREWDAAFGSYPALVHGYTVAESNASARRVEEIAGGIGFGLGLRRGWASASTSPLSEAEREAFRLYVDGELTRPSGEVAPPPAPVADFLAARRTALNTFEEFLSSAPPPRWASDPSGDEENWPQLALGAHVQLHRLLVADALLSSSKGETTGAVRALEASWNLGSALTGRPEVTSQMMATAVGRFQTGGLRRVGGSTRTWGRRLDEMGSRRQLVDALLLQQGDVRESRMRLRRLMAKERSAWVAPIAPFLEVNERLWYPGYSRGWMRAIEGLRDAPAFEEPKDVAPRTDKATEIILAIAVPNLRSIFERADRLALDAELTGKILRVKEVRRAQGAWPQPSVEISTSSFPGLSWNYSVDAGAMTIALNRELPKPAAGLVLPTSFSSRAPAP